MAHIDATFVQQVFYIPKRQWKPHIHHHCQADDLWARLEVAKRRGLGHTRTLGRPPAGLKCVSSDITFGTNPETIVCPNVNFVLRSDYT